MRQDEREVGVGFFVESNVVDFAGPLEGGEHLFDLGEGSEVSFNARDAVAVVGQGGVRATQGRQWIVDLAHQQYFQRGE